MGPTAERGKRCCYYGKDTRAREPRYGKHRAQRSEAGHLGLFERDAD
jgi:hypothetical protein